MKYVVSRHAGALQLCRLQGINADKTVAHLDPSSISPGDMVIGTLPVATGRASASQRWALFTPDAAFAG